MEVDKPTIDTPRKKIKRTPEKYIPVSCMVCASTSGWKCSKCHQGICHTCAYNVFADDVFDPDNDAVFAVRPSWGKCPMCRSLLKTVFEPARLWVCTCECGKPFSASTKESAALLVEEHQAMDCPNSIFAPCDIPRKDLVEHVLHCNKPDCLRMRHWIQEVRRLHEEQSYTNAEMTVLRLENKSLLERVESLEEDKERNPPSPIGI